MNRKLEQVLDTERRVLDLKRTHSDHGSICSSGKVSFPLDLSCVLSCSKLPKRRRLDASGRCDFQSGRRLLKCYSDFKRTGNLQRLLYYQNDEWIDFSESVVELVNKDLIKNTSVEVQVSGSRILLDFLQKMQWDLDTGSCKSIAWIDVSGKCFFPEEIFNDSDGHVFEPKHVEDCDLIETEPQGYSDVKLNLEIEVRAFDYEGSGDCDGESIDCGAKGSPVQNDHHLLNGKLEENLNLEVTSVNRSADFSAVRDIFFRAIKPDTAEIVAIRECKSLILDSHFELFEKQLEITKKYRGDGNVRYAWFPCPDGTVQSILNFGIGHYNLHKDNRFNGAGLCLIPANGTQFSISDIDAEENGSRHVVLCRVIMGNMEVVHCGSEQSHPSSDNFDSGVDDPQAPSCYILWTMNMNARIYPECVVSFKITLQTEGYVCESSNMPGVGASTSIPSNKRLPANVSIPKSPWMPFPVLFTCISSRISPQKMEIVRLYYDLFKTKMIPRDSFIAKLRVIVGDAVLKSAITSLRREIPEASTSVVETS